MFKLIRELSFFCLAFSGILILSGCETEQTSSKENDAMVGYAQELANKQAEFASEEQLKKLKDHKSDVVINQTNK
ncbi:hypothetical protein OHV67_11775 [Acinetobacter baumannii]|nr:hypothetical protein [Acinetobacter baumannii]EKT9964865.1 hypothetical protein [Acinetobacter baumannii]EKW3631866.1 hypothetical protein [Acinetobacter baumannii]EKW3730796.1 hypothetical protein [Acinetobacter baumannii]EKW5784171.1 hypothetical protein [Acinetobacter baumannii]